MKMDRKWVLSWYKLVFRPRSASHDYVATLGSCLEDGCLNQIPLYLTKYASPKLQLLSIYLNSKCKTKPMLIDLWNAHGRLAVDKENIF